MPELLHRSRCPCSVCKHTRRIVNSQNLDRIIGPQRAAPKSVRAVEAAAKQARNEMPDTPEQLRQDAEWLRSKCTQIMYIDSRLTKGDAMRLSSIAASLEASRWVSVKERLPEKLVNVFCWESDAGECGIGYYLGDDSWYRPNSDDEYLVAVTHWMALPDPPEAKGAPDA